jgi:branched-chain amino acid transport system ATP-binding protein
MTIVLIEHNMQVLDLCDRAVVINYGHKIAEGSPEEVRKNKEVARAYFGSEIERFDNGTSRACSNACPAPAPYHHDALLSVKNIVVHYGKSMALDNVSIEVAKGKVVTILGANGAGKTTILKALSGLKSLTSGEIWFLNNRIDGRETNEIVKLGIVHIPEGRKLFPYLNVLTNLKLGASLRKDKAGINQDMDEIFERFPILWERRNQQAGSLSGGEQQMLAIARGLMAKPKLLLMDEPSLGLAPTVIDELARVIKDINQGGVSVLLVEQNISLALRVANRGYALQVGRVVLEGDINDFRDTESVSKAYLGK